MRENEKKRELLTALEAAATLHGFDLVDLEYQGSSRAMTLRVYIDKPDGLTLDDVASTNSWISEVVETLDPFRGSYTLEVSSPGIDRPLRTLAHFERAVGEEAIITLLNHRVSSANENPAKTHENTKPRFKYTGIITKVDTQGQLITLETEGAPVSIAFGQIKKARIKGRIDFVERKDS